MSERSRIWLTHTWRIHERLFSLWSRLTTISANQGIIQKSRRFDQVGERTVGIITKPDLINEGTQERIALLAKNEDTTKLKLGFFHNTSSCSTNIQGPSQSPHGLQLPTRPCRQGKWPGLGLSSLRSVWRVRVLSSPARS